MIVFVKMIAKKYESIAWIVPWPQHETKTKTKSVRTHLNARGGVCNHGHGCHESRCGGDRGGSAPTRVVEGGCEPCVVGRRHLGNDAAK